MKLDTLYRWTDETPRDCAAQMALDEILFRITQKRKTAFLRFYSWDTKALTFGYSESYPVDSGPGAVRRFTGGGRVEHGEDLTFLLTLPADVPEALLPAAQRYQWIHECLRKAFMAVGLDLDAEKDPGNVPTGPCFETPVAHDLMAPGTGEKVVGGAQRRSRGSVIHQGSLRLPSPLREDHGSWSGFFERELAQETLPFPSGQYETHLKNAERLAGERYRNDSWNRKR